MLGASSFTAVACFHLPSFPAWAVARSLKTGRPVAVVQAGRVVAATPDARRAGVRAGMPAERVTDVADRAEVHLRDAAREHAMWGFVLERLHTLTPFLESAGQGVAFLRQASAGELKAAAVDLGACVGVAPQRRLARLAAARAAPGRVLSLSTETLARFLGRTPVDVFCDLGFEEEVAERLRLFGYPTLDRVATLSARHLKAQFGDAVGGELSAFLNPPREHAIGRYRPPEAAVAEYALEWDEDLRYEEQFDAVTTRLVEEAHGKLNGWRCRRLVVRLSDGRDERVATRVLPRATGRLPYLLRQVRALLRSPLEAAESLSALRVELHSLSAGDFRQGSLWRSRPTLEDAARKIEQRFPGACARAVRVPHALLPEDEYRRDPFVVLQEDER